MSILFFMTAFAIGVTIEEAVEKATRPRYGTRKYYERSKAR